MLLLGEDLRSLRRRPVEGVVWRRLLVAAMADWQERVQSMIIGFVFAYMVMKLFSVISSFRAGNLRVARASDEEESLLVPSEVVELASGDEQAGPLVATDEETEADGGDEQEAHSSSSSSDSEAEDDAAPAWRSREIDSAVEPTVSGVESKGEDVIAKNDEEVQFKKGDGVEDVVKMESKDVGAAGEQSLKALVRLLAPSIIATILPCLCCHLVEDTFSILYRGFEGTCLFDGFSVGCGLVFLAKVRSVEILS